MTLLYRVEGEIAIEMSREAWERVRELVDKDVSARDYHAYSAHREQELKCFASAIRSHLQHLEAEKPAPPPSNNFDLI